jgi:hypothetical protein
MSSQGNEVQKHGFVWEKDILCNIYGATKEELKEIKYTNRIDLPAHLNRLDKCNISVKTTKDENTVCMADCLRVFDAVSSGTPKHMVVVHYEQIQNIKKIINITEVDLTDTRDLLFGTLTRSQIEELDKLVKSVPKGRAPNPQEKNEIDSLRDYLRGLSGAILLNVKIDSKNQRRLQCSFNNFPQFLEENPERIVATSNTNEFRGGTISSQIISGPRVFNENQIV